MGPGPLLAVGSEAFQTLSLGGGVEWLVPASAEFPFVLAVGGFERQDTSSSSRAGFLGEVLWGSRGYNLWGGGSSLGFFVEGRYAGGA